MIAFEPQEEGEPKAACKQFSEQFLQYLSRLRRSLVIEFVPKSDSQVKRLLVSRPDIFPDYTKDGFETAFARHFTIESSARVADSERWLYYMTATQNRDG
jgi:hypothetical protein